MDEKFEAYTTSDGYILMESNDSGWDYTLLNMDGCRVDDGVMLTGSKPVKAVASQICKDKGLKLTGKADYNKILDLHINARIAFKGNQK